MKCLVSAIIFFLFIVSMYAPITSLDTHENDLLNIDFPDDIPKLNWMGPYGSYEDYQNRRNSKDFTIQRISQTINDPDNPTIIIFINSNLIPEINDKMIIYNLTLIANGYNTIINEVSGGVVEDLKTQIVFYWNFGYNLSGVVLIGDHPVAWYHHEYDPSDFPCDLYLMDLDGQWIDADNDGLFESHIDGSGDTAPEIFVGRIDASYMPGNEIDVTEAFLGKVHDFWIGDIPHTDYALTYTEADWSNYNDIRFSMGYGYDMYQAIWYPNVNRDDYVFNRVSNDTYEFIQLACHSWSGGHSFSIGGYATSDDIRNAPPKALFYNLFCCGALRFTDYNCLGNAYILDTESPSLSVVGSTKSGSMLNFIDFYEQIGLGKSFGESFQRWFEEQYPYSNGDISWFYGMGVLGDPTLNTTPNKFDFHDGLVTNLSSNWDFVSIPFNQSFNISDLFIKYDEINYSWNEAVSDNIVSSYVSSWNRSGQYYMYNTILEPGCGYWIYTYDDCELWTEYIITISRDFKTDLEPGWNIIGISINENVSKTELLFNDTSWSDAVTNGWISDFIFGWDRAGQYYNFVDTLMPGYAYWVYAYQPCTLKRTI